MAPTDDDRGLVHELASLFDQVEADRHFVPQERLNLKDRTRTSVLPWKGQFTPELIDVLLGAYANAEAIVLDPFVGSGTTLIECGRTTRMAYGYDVNTAAAYSARTAELINIPRHERERLFHDVAALLTEQLEQFRQPDLFTWMHERQPGRDFASTVNSLFGTCHGARHVETILMNVVMQAMGENGRGLDADVLFSSFARYRNTCSNLPYSASPLYAAQGDARCVPLDNETIDLIITSPPYINVFNYHQNYRKALEFVGLAPLNAAPSEIGANRKHRGNRLWTVIQYCLDMREALIEAHRVLRPASKMVMVVGRESTVLGHRFENGKALYCIAIGSAGFSLLRRHERAFTNRFGEHIFEEIFVLTKVSDVQQRPASFAHAVGEYLLRQSLAHLSKVGEDDRRADVENALAQVGKIKPSPYWLVT